MQGQDIYINLVLRNIRPSKFQQKITVINIIEFYGYNFINITKNPYLDDNNLYILQLPTNQPVS